MKLLNFRETRVELGRDFLLGDDHHGKTPVATPQLQHQQQREAGLSDVFCGRGAFENHADALKGRPDRSFTPGHARLVSSQLSNGAEA